MPEVAQFKKALERTLEIPIGDGGVLKIRWSPQNVSPEFWETIKAESKTETARAAANGGKVDWSDLDPFEVVEKIIAPLMSWWDLTVEGELFPITVENIVSFGLPFVGRLSRAIQADFAIGDDVKKASADRSSTQA